MLKSVAPAGSKSQPRRDTKIFVSASALAAASTSSSFSKLVYSYSGVQYVNTNLHGEFEQHILQGEKDITHMRELLIAHDRMERARADDITGTVRFNSHVGCARGS